MEQNQKEFIVYKITHIDSKKSYIGITTDYKRRIDHHLRAKGNCLYLYSAINKYGKEKFTHEIIWKCNSWEELCREEIEYIKVFNTHAPAGYNLTEGGEGTIGLKCTEETKRKRSKSQIGKKHTEETKRKISKSNTGKQRTKEVKKQMSVNRAGEKHYMFGKKCKEETKKKISKSKIGTKCTEKTKEQMSKSHIGQKHTEAAKRNMSKAQTGKKHTEETKRKISKSKIGTKHTEETKNQISINQIGEKNHMFGKKHTSDAKLKISLSRGKLTLQEKEQVVIGLKIGIKAYILAKQYNVGRHVIDFIKKKYNYKIHQAISL